MLLSKNSLLKNYQARRFVVLAFFISVSLLFLSGCDFDQDTGDYQSIEKNKLQRARVVRVKDGDSLILRFEGSIEKEARLFGIDAPDYRYLQKIKILGVVA